jgi:hypothetical protein
MPKSMGGTPRASAISRAAVCLASMKSMSLGVRLMDFQSRPPSKSRGRPAWAAPWKPCSSSALRRSNWSGERLPSRAV